MKPILALGLLLGLAACAVPPPGGSARTPNDAHEPPFARIPYEPLTRQAVVAIALREWRVFGSPVDDDPPGSRPPPIDKPERDPGLWQRVGEYWWLGLNADDPDNAWTGKHDTNGFEFPPQDDARYAWSAAFVSYVMRIAGAAGRFPYSASHSDYINVAKQMALGQTTGWIIQAEDPVNYAPQPGDLICLGRGRSGSLRYADLPSGRFPAHCDFVVDTTVPGQISVIGGNVDDAVTMKHVPVTPDGKLATPDGQVLDTRYPWMVVLRLNVSTPVS